MTVSSGHAKARCQAHVPWGEFPLFGDAPAQDRGENAHVPYELPRRIFMLQWKVRFAGLLTVLALVATVLGGAWEPLNLGW